VADLADLMRAVADGEPPPADARLTVVPPPDDRSVGVLAFSGHTVVSAYLAEDWVRSWPVDDDLAAPLGPHALIALAAATGRTPDSLDQVLVAPATGRSNGMELTELDEFLEPLHPRLARALGHRIGVRAWHCPGGLLTLGRGVAGRWEVSVEVEPALRGFGLGRGLFTAARGLLPVGDHVWAQVAPGNAASVRAALAAGFRPVGAEVLLRPGRLTFGTFGWFEAYDGEVDTVEPPSEPSGVTDVDSPAMEQLLPVIGDDRDTNIDAVSPRSVPAEPTTQDESVD
jgi:GNAT superfamily N-acetyltransferase